MVCIARRAAEGNHGSQPACGAENGAPYGRSESLRPALSETARFRSAYAWLFLEIPGVGLPSDSLLAKDPACPPPAFPEVLRGGGVEDDRKTPRRPHAPCSRISAGFSKNRRVLPRCRSPRSGLRTVCDPTPPPETPAAPGPSAPSRTAPPGCERPRLLDPSPEVLVLEVVRRRRSAREMSRHVVGQMAEIQKPDANPLPCRGYFCRAARGSKSAETAKADRTFAAAGTAGEP